MPYVWGGETDTASSQYGPQAHGGYDCSGFVWRVFKLSGDPAGASIGGRTAAAMALEIPKSERLKFATVQPADLLFFGNATSRTWASRSSQDFMIHSRARASTIAPLFDDWRQVRVRLGPAGPVDEQRKARAPGGGWVRGLYANCEL